MRVKLRRKSKGQSTLEYIIVLTAIIALIIWAAGHFFGGEDGAIGTSLTQAGNAIERAADRLVGVDVSGDGE